MSEERPLRGTALLLGAAAVALIVVGVVIVLAEGNGGSSAGGLLIRAGAVVGALALVLPGTRKPSGATLLVAGAGLILVLARPALVWVALAVWAYWLVARRRSTSDSES